MDQLQDPICSRVRENLTAYADGELDAGELRRLIEQHLAECQQCRAHLDQLKDTWRLLDELEPPVVRTDLQRKVLARVEDERRKGPVQRLALRFGWSTMATAAAAVVAAVLLFAGVLRVTEPGLPAPAAGDQHLVTYLDFLRDFELLRHLDTVEELRRLGETISPDDASPLVSPGEGVTSAAADEGASPAENRTISEALNRAAEAAAARQSEAPLLPEFDGGEVSADLEAIDG